ncbi:MAG: efflux RND transporter permease subunit [Clostridiales Family XIII bacterium]|nr:efflux RND transporter permease subunit [Clostridiales Family XIII bacterium]
MIKLSVRKPFIVFVLIVAIFAFGFGGIRSMTPDLLPKMDLPYIVLMTTYPGASPEKVEGEVTKPLERTLSTLENLKTIQSESADNYSAVFMEFESNANIDALLVDILEKTRQIEGGWDDMIGTPLIMKINPDMMPIMVAAVDRKGLDTSALSILVRDELRSKLEGTTGVASVDVIGLVDVQMNVILREDKIDALNKTISDAVNNQFAEVESELAGTQSQIEGQLGELTAANNTLLDGVKQLADGVGDGSAQLSANTAALLEGKVLLESQLSVLAMSLTTLIEGEQAAINIASNAGITLPPDVTNQFAQGKTDINNQIIDLQAKLMQLQGADQALIDAQKQLSSLSITSGFELANGAAQLSSAQAQLSMALGQVEQGLSQLSDAREDAVSNSNIKSMLTMEMLSGILYAQNFSMPAGYVHEGKDDYLVRVGAEINSLEELQNLPLLDMGLEGLGTIKLSDVADVFQSDNLDTLYAKINGEDGVILTFQKQSTHATAEVSKNIQAKFDALSEEYPDLHFTALMDQGEYIYIIIGAILQNLLLGSLFAILILFLFLRDIRPTFITLCSIPISVVFAVVLMYFSGVTINIISLSGLAISVGMLVDNSIVAIENIFRLRQKGYSAVKAAISGTSQIAAAITSSTLTTICVFLPIVFTHGITRQLFADLALTLAYSLVASLIIALTLVPAMAGGLFHNMVPKEDKLLKRVLGKYDTLLTWTLKHKAIVLISVLLLLAGSTYGVLARGFSFIPSADSPQLSVSLNMPEGTSFEKLKSTANEITERILPIKGVKTVGALSGGNSMGGMFGFGGGSGDDEIVSADYYVVVDESIGGDAIAKEIEKRTKDIDAEVIVNSSASMDLSSMGGSGISVHLFGENIDDLIQVAGDITQGMSKIKGVSNIEGIEETSPEIRFTVDKEKAAKKGLTVAQVYAEISKVLTNEQTATTVSWDNDTYDVVLVTAEDEKLTPAYIKDLSFDVTKNDGTKERVKLADVSTVADAKSLMTIHRYQQRRELVVDVEITEGTSVTHVADEVEKYLDKATLPDGVSYELAGEDQTITDAFRDLVLMMVMGLLLVYLVMVAQFQSLKSPFIILFTVPLAFTGGFVALFVTGMNLSVISLIGFVMLIGIIVNNGIVLVDYINQLRLEGVERIEAIREAGSTRMRPILMTATTTILGLSVMAFGIGTGSEMMQPLAIVCIGGLLYATLMTLFIVPIIYDIFNKKDPRIISEEDMIVDYDA